MNIVLHSIIKKKVGSLIFDSGIMKGSFQMISLYSNFSYVQNKKKASSKDVDLTRWSLLRSIFNP